MLTVLAGAVLHTVPKRFLYSRNFTPIIESFLSKLRNLKVRTLFHQNITRTKKRLEAIYKTAPASISARSKVLSGKALS